MKKLISTILLGLVFVNDEFIPAYGTDATEFGY